jgi:demethoxyubiquinone hydroxylase (CLK1/Coq7/Cat5 family)
MTATSRYATPIPTTPLPAPVVSARELEWLNFYRASELQGGLVLGTLAQRVRDGQLALSLLRHSAEEVEHARLWTETLLAVGGAVRPAPRTYQAGYARELGPPRTIVEVLALTQVFERRVWRHFTRHLRRPGTHPLVRATLQRMLDEERDHLSWVRRWLDRRPDADALLRRYAEVDERIYQEYLELYGWSDA